MQNVDPRQDGESRNLLFRTGPGGAPETAIRVIGGPRHSPESIARTIGILQSMSETQIAVLQVANGWSPQGAQFASRDALISAADMLLVYQAHQASSNHRRDAETLEEALDNTLRRGIALGIEQEKQRAKEARRGRGKK